MTEAPDGVLWLVSRGGIVGAGDPRSGRFRTVDGVARDGAARRRSGRGTSSVLVGTSRGLIALERSSGREVALDAGAADAALGERPIAAIRSAPDGAWIAAGKDLIRVVRAADARTRCASSARMTDCGIGVGALGGWRRPALDWIRRRRGRARGVERSCRGRGRAIAAVDGAPARDSLAAHGLISALHEDRQGRLWVGTRRGLGRIEPESGTVSWLGQQEGLPSTNIAGIVGDADGRLWVGHNRGLTRIDPETGAMTHFGERDGAQGKGYAEGAWAAGGSGLIYFAGDGVTAFDPREVRVSPDHPRIVFTALESFTGWWRRDGWIPDSPLDRTIDAQRR